MHAQTPPNRLTFLLCTCRFKITLTIKSDSKIIGIFYDHCHIVIKHFHCKISICHIHPEYLVVFNFETFNSTPYVT